MPVPALIAAVNDVYEIDLTVTRRRSGPGEHPSRFSGRQRVVQECRRAAEGAAHDWKDLGCRFEATGEGLECPP